MTRSQLFRAAFAVAGVGGLSVVVYGQRDALADLPWSSRPGDLAVAALLFSLAPLLQALTFLVGLRRLGVRSDAGAALRLWSRSFLLRYEPSGLLGFAYRVRERDRLGATAPQMLTVTGYEQLAAVAAGALAAVGGFVVAGVRPSWPALVLLGLVLALAASLRPQWLGGRLVGLLEARGLRTAGLLPGRTLAALVAVDAAGWVATGAGAVVLSRALEIDGLGTGLLIGAFALSWLLGVLVPLAPGGLGLRDGAFIVGVGVAIGAGPATALAVALRVVSLAGELLAAGIVEAGVAVAGGIGRAAATQRISSAMVAGFVPPAAGTVAARPRRAGSVVVVPTYEEVEMLPRFVERFAATGLELLIVDDASPDGTGALADALAAERPWMHVLHREAKDGLGMAYRAGFDWCLKRGYAVIGQMDCDLSHPPEKLLDMLAVLEARSADLVIGNRYLPGGGTAGWSRGRRVLSRVGCTGSKLVLGLPYDDLSGGFKLWRADCLAGLGLDGMLSAGYAFQVETTQLAHLTGARIEEVPFVFSERVAGESKMSLAVTLEGVRVTFALRQRARRSRRWGP
ncbi:GtrB-like O-antigen conversion [Paraconexibacter sp. AEG42_29]|uniref:GtrB-like O-antigen conversion n=1 Tax=Paraconexibacter sp. AEG42_29 TaxID=2997339 RepID=A0AAU7AWE0_9ACTN